MDYGTSSRKRIKLLGIIILILTLQLIITTYQVIRYEENVYDCSDMSEDCEEIFESIGLRTWMVLGERYNGSSHVWLMIETPIVCIPFESTCLAPVSPRIFNSYDNLKISEGCISNGQPVELVYKDW